jgi:hypothetical protein
MITNFLEKSYDTWKGDPELKSLGFITNKALYSIQFLISCDYSLSDNAANKYLSSQQQIIVLQKDLCSLIVNLVDFS